VTNTELTGAVDRLIELAAHTSIVSHNPGKIHLKVKLAGISLALSLKNIRVPLPGILGAKGDVTDRSVVINYDEKVLPKELWDLLFKAHANAKIKQLVRKEILARVSMN
jgi:hypothetical protein